MKIYDGVMTKRRKRHSQHFTGEKGMAGGCVISLSPVILLLDLANSTKVYVPRKIVLMMSIWFGLLKSLESRDINFGQPHTFKNYQNKGGVNLCTKMYLRNDKKHRYVCFVKNTKNKKQVQLASLPPTSVAAHQHLLRVYYQVQVWLGYQLDPTDWGWKLVDNTLEPVQTLLPPAPEKLLNTIFCNCKKGCSAKCGCKKVGLFCSLACTNCQGRSCSNVVSLTEEDSFDSNENTSLLTQFTCTQNEDEEEQEEEKRRRRRTRTRTRRTTRPLSQEDKSPADDEEEAGEGVVSLNKVRGTDTFIDMPRTETATTCLLEKPPIDKKVKYLWVRYVIDTKPPHLYGVAENSQARHSFEADYQFKRFTNLLTSEIPATDTSASTKKSGIIRQGHFMDIPRTVKLESDDGCVSFDVKKPLYQRSNKRIIGRRLMEIGNCKDDKMCKVPHEHENEI
ncbi:hypothetical protein NQ317_013108 [Molorchus minor]|uniref:Uncharacterized protein n=1 Tax=Molorchus minor TaxID=1323400 RepID=A0ABQ9JYG1_9CUCU|nr:hypothetical protein NQ317_013108 [Molorchus minor]